MRRSASGRPGLGPGRGPAGEQVEGLLGPASQLRRLLAAAPPSTPVWALAGLMILVVLAGPLVSPPATAVLLNSVPGHQAGTASGVFNISRQVGGALAVAVFGARLAQPATFTQPPRGSRDPEIAPA